MRLLVLALLLYAACAGGNCEAAGTGQGYADDDKASQELVKELEDYNKQTQQVLQRVDNLAKRAPVSKESLYATKARAIKLANDDRFLQIGRAHV